ncbi:hypothetical protein [Catalinimonas niigatensis]|uniref:hypothetical protein n=1 Tax=Catalinimonas niigatensis TaxID=1397264 RepID=UPI00266583F8|nr:hypothetical protein [Catalinimonas niigatensis]WPP50390.1 hypothetical protein PZB72_27360 [Catalinimonas niigatensis]
MMIIDMLLALVALGGSAVLGYLMGKQTAGKSTRETLQKQQIALKKAEQSLSETVMQLTRCTRRRRDLAMKVKDLMVKIDKKETEEKAVPIAASPQRISPDNGKDNAENNQNEVLKRIKAKAAHINFERIGRSSAHEKDDLKQIKGVGPFIEEKLNALGIYTFAQLSNFNQEDENKVNEAIEFFPGRIKRDGWVAQAKALKAGKTIG